MLCLGWSTKLVFRNEGASVDGEKKGWKENSTRKSNVAGGTEGACEDPGLRVGWCESERRGESRLLTPDL